MTLAAAALPVPMRGDSYPVVSVSTLKFASTAVQSISPAIPKASTSLCAARWRSVGVHLDAACHQMPVLLVRRHSFYRPYFSIVEAYRNASDLIIPSVSSSCANLCSSCMSMARRGASLAASAASLPMPTPIMSIACPASFRACVSAMAASRPGRRPCLSSSSMSGHRITESNTESASRQATGGRGVVRVATTGSGSLAASARASAAPSQTATLLPRMSPIVQTASLA